MSLKTRIEKLETATALTAYVWRGLNESKVDALIRWRVANPGRDASQPMFISWLRDAEHD